MQTSMIADGMLFRTTEQLTDDTFAISSYLGASNYPHQATFILKIIMPVFNKVLPLPSSAEQKVPA
jgi:hypothetical protein